MKRNLLLLALIVASALPALAQSGEFGILLGGSRRFVDGAPREEGTPEFTESNFSFSETSFDMFWAMPLDDDTRFKVKGGRIETPVAFAYELPDDPNVYRRDVEGQVQHIEGGVEYRFSEVFGSTSLFAGLGLYRQTGPDFDSTTNAGASFGLNADFPITRRYGIVLDGTYHWVRADFQPRFLTLGVGIRIAF